MALTINTNMASMLVQKNMNASTSALNQAIQRMTTGYKINSAKDDAAGMAVAIKLDTQLGAYDVASQNVQMGSALLTTAEENDNLVLGHLQRIRDLAEQAANGVYDSSSTSAIATEIDARIAEINRLTNSVEFNGKSLMNGTIGTVKVQVGIDGSSNSAIDISSALVNTTANGTTMLNTYGTDVVEDEEVTTSAGTKIVNDAMSSVENTRKGVFNQIDTAIGTVKNAITAIGSYQNRLDSASESIEVAKSNVSSALSTVRDADVSTESSNYIKAQILQQAAASLLTTANQSPSIALNLI